jgi:hypothetical protein
MGMALIVLGQQERGEEQQDTREQTTHGSLTVERERDSE